MMPSLPPIAVIHREDIPGERLQAYVDAIEAAGGQAVSLSPDDERWAGSSAANFAAIVLTGGVDIDPSLYGAERHERVRRVDRFRDDFELDFVRDALDHDLPLLGVCRGHQLLNVAFGGGLLQHIEDNSHRSERETLASRWHEATLVPGSRLATIYGAGTLRVNSRHHQAVTPETLAPGLVVSATTPDGLIEGLESPAHRFVLSVQWHPEREELRDQSEPLFRALVEATGG